MVEVREFSSNKYDIREDWYTKTWLEEASVSLPRSSTPSLNETSRAFQRAILTPRCHCETTLYPHSSCITDSASEEVDVIEDIGNNCSSPRHYHFSTVAQAAVLAALSRGSSLDEPAYSQRENGTEFQNISNKLASWVRQTCDYEDRKPLNAAAFLIKESVRCQEDW